MLKFYQPGS